MYRFCSTRILRFCQEDRVPECFEATRTFVHVSLVCRSKLYVRQL